MSVDELKSFLTTLPSKLDYRSHHLLRLNLFKALYYAATNDGQYLKSLYPFIGEEEVDSMANYRFDVSKTNDQKPFYNYKQKRKYIHAPGSVCARPFKRGEPVYRCEQCGFDDTCVLCVHCFNKDDHADHDVYMYISQGNSNGICDCGDPDAFTSELHCRCQSEQASEIDSPELPEDFDMALRETIRVCLDYILDVTNYSVLTLPFIHRSINRPNCEFTSQFLSNYSSLPADRYGVEDSNSEDLWYLILWNDEHHNTEEAIRDIRSAIKTNRGRAEVLAGEVTTKGRCILHESSDYKSLLPIQKLVEVEGLVASIMSARDFMREMIVHHIFSWLIDIILFTSHTRFREQSKHHFGEILLEPNFSFAKPFPSDGIFSMVKYIWEEVDSREQFVRKFFENGLLLEGQFINIGKTKVHPNITPDKCATSISGVLGPDPRLDRLQNSRLQYLLDFQIRFTLAIRKRLPDLIIPAVISDTRKKSIFCEQFINLYPVLITSMARADREEHLNCLPEITTQLFTCPTSVNSILKDGKLGYVLGSVADIIEKYSSEWNPYSQLPNFIEIARGRPSNYKAIKRAILGGIRDIDHLVDKSSGQDSLPVLLSKDTIVFLILFLRNFQGYWCVKRKYGDHVEREILDFVIHLEYSVPVLNVVKSITSRETNDTQLVINSVKLIIEFLSLREIKWKAPGIADFKVSKEPASFVNAVNTLLSYIIQFHGFQTLQDVLSTYEGPFMRISDISLRSIVLSSQVKVGFWIRNGISVSRQASLYTDSLMRDLAYFCDFYLNQIAAIYDNPSTTLLNFLERWELSSWFNNETPHNETIYEDRFSSISNRFVVFLYNLITDRTNFLSLSSRERVLYRAEQAICYALCNKPKPYSSLKSEVSIEVSELPEFDSLLEKCCDYQSPQGLVDSGMYRLKPSIFEKLDPLSLHLDTSQSQEVTEALIKNIAQDRKISEDSVVLSPQIQLTDIPLVDEHLASFTKTKEFAKLMYKYLQVAIDSSDETYLGNLLHLLHAVVKDDELHFSENYVCPHFIDIPISDLLFTLSESSMSKIIVKKAEFLLKNLIRKDERVIQSLIDCFGEEHIKAFQSKHIDSIKSEPEKRKLLAEKRKNKVMKKFAKQREKFLLKNVEYSLDTDTNTLNTSNTHLRTCVLCGEHESSDDVFGLLASFNSSSVFWKVPEDDVEFFQLAFKDWDQQWSPKQNGVYGRGYNYSSARAGYQNASPDGYVLSTCGHGLHLRCYYRASAAFKFYPCSLCRNLSNIFIPSYISPKHNETGDDILFNNQPINDRYNQLTYGTCTEKARLLVSKLVIEDFQTFDPEQIESVCKPIDSDVFCEIFIGRFFVSGGNEIQFFNKLQSLANLLANTIRMNEISTRIEGTRNLSNFLNDIPAPSKTLMRSLMQILAIAYEKRHLSFFLGSNYDLSKQIKEFWDSECLLDSIFNEVVALFFQTDESLKTLITWGYTKYVTVCINSLLHMLLTNREYFDSFASIDLPQINPQILLSLGTLLSSYENIEIPNYLKNKEQLTIIVWTALKRLILPFLRQMVIFKDLLTMTSEGDNEYQSMPELQNLKEEISNQEDIYAEDALCDVLGIPNLSTFLLNLVESQVSEFERKIFDIVLTAKIPKYMDQGILSLDFPAVVKLIDLPDDYNTCVIEYDSGLNRGRYDYNVCLHCGSKLHLSEDFGHMRKCNMTSVFFHPRLNLLKLATRIANSPIYIKVSAPYLTSHGEVKRPRSSGKATLSHLRYNHLNKLWLNQGLNGFITRNMFGSMDEGQEIEPNFTFPETTEMDDDEDDDFNFFYQDDIAL